MQPRSFTKIYGDRAVAVYAPREWNKTIPYENRKSNTFWSFIRSLKGTVSQTAHVQVINQKWSDVFKFVTVKQNGVNKRRTIVTVTEAGETTLAASSFF